MSVRITLDSVKHDNSFKQYHFNNMFQPNGPSSGWQKWKINIQFRMEIGIAGCLKVITSYPHSILKTMFNLMRDHYTQKIV